MSVGSLVKQFLCEGLDGIKRLKKNRAQTESHAAIKISHELMGASRPPHLSTVIGTQERARWLNAIDQWSQSVHELATTQLASFERSDAMRKRAPSGTISSVVQAWSVMKKSRKETSASRGQM